MSTDYRALCAELLSLLDNLAMRNPEMDGGLLRRRARAALAQPKPVALTTAEIDTLWLATWNDKTQQYDVAAFARAIIAADRARYAHPTIQPVPVSERIASIAKAVQECAFAWEPDARLIGNVCAEDIADLCGAILAPPHNATR
jgi:hypothetical protein